MSWSGSISAGSALKGAGTLFDAMSNYGASKANAKNIYSSGLYQAEMMRQQGFSDASSARAAAAESGLDVDVGSVAMIQDQHIGDAAYNAYITKSQAKYQADLMKRQAKTALISGLMGAGANLFGG